MSMPSLVSPQLSLTPPRRSALAHIPGNEGWPIVGNTLRVLADPKGHVERNSLTYGPVYRTNMFGESQVLAVVSRGGRPDLARQRLGSVRAATLLIVGSADPAVLDLNRRAQARLRCPSRLEVVAGASHLFEEPGTLGQAALLAKDWFCAHLLRPPVPPVVGASR